MSPREMDERCVFELFATSSGAARERYRREMLRGTPAYDPVPPYRDPRDFPVRCRSCGRLVWVSGTGGGSHRRYCSDACKLLHYYHTHPAYRLRARERARASYWRAKAVA